VISPRVDENKGPLAAALPPPVPRITVVGGLPRLRSTLRGDFNLEFVTPDNPIKGPTDIVILDGSLPASRLKLLVEPLGPAGSVGRPTVLVVTPDGRRGRLDRLLAGHADDFVNAALGGGELLGRIRGALRVRGYLAELSRKNAELEGLYARLEALAQRMADELRLASSVQRSLLPTPPSCGRLEMAREFIPFREIGGDYYDFLSLTQMRMAFAIGDVMGKGVPAALLAANLKASVRAQLQSPEAPPGEMVSRINQLFSEVTPRGRFASLFLGVFDFARGTLAYVNAGHDYPFVVSTNGRLQDLSQGGPVLGLLEKPQYEAGEIAIGQGDLIVFYSDGLTDRSNQEGEIYGVDRLKEAALRSRHDGARIALYTLLGEAQGWSAGVPPEDDMTLVVAKVR